MNPKVRSKKILNFINSDSRRKLSVIIELHTKKPKPRLKKRGYSKYSLLKSLDMDSNENIKNMDVLGDELSKLGVEDNNLVRLDSALAYVGSVNPKQLKNIMELPLVDKIKLNRTHYVSKLRL